MVKYLRYTHKKLLESRDVVGVPDNYFSCYKASLKFANIIEPNSISLIDEFTSSKEDLIDYVTINRVDKILKLLGVD